MALEGQSGKEHFGLTHHNWIPIGRTESRRHLTYRDQVDIDRQNNVRAEQGNAASMVIASAVNTAIATNITSQPTPVNTDEDEVMKPPPPACTDSKVDEPDGTMIIDEITGMSISADTGGSSGLA